MGEKDRNPFKKQGDRRNQKKGITMKKSLKNLRGSQYFVIGILFIGLISSIYSSILDTNENAKELALFSTLMKNFNEDVSRAVDIVEDKNLSLTTDEKVLLLQNTINRMTSLNEQMKSLSEINIQNLVDHNAIIIANFVDYSETRNFTSFKENTELWIHKMVPAVQTAADDSLLISKVDYALKMLGLIILAILFFGKKRKSEIYYVVKNEAIRRC